MDGGFYDNKSGLPIGIENEPADVNFKARTVHQDDDAIIFGPILEALLRLKEPLDTSLPSTFTMDGNFYDNKSDLPIGIENEPADVNFKARTVHQDDAAFPLIPPDMWYNTSTKKTDMVDDIEGRQRYKQQVPDSTWKKECKHYVKGGFYKNIAGRFYIIPMDGPEKTRNTKKEKTWGSKKYRIEVTVRDGQRDLKTKTYIEFTHSPLLELCRKDKRGFGKLLKENAVALEIQTNDCCKGVNVGAMAVTGTRCYNGKLMLYSNTNKERLTQLNKLAESYFYRSGFGRWVHNLRNKLTQTGPVSAKMDNGVMFPWFSLSVTTQNYCNESHIDTNSACQGIAIWHEKFPNIRKKGPNTKNWYFIFPDMEIWAEGEWKKGVAIPLVHGTIVSWDARLLRHCTAVPTLVNVPNQPTNVAWGTYFGIHTRVEAKLVQDNKDNKKRCRAEM